MFSIKSFITNKIIYIKLLLVFFSFLALMIGYNAYQKNNKSLLPVDIINRNIYKYPQKRIYITGSVKYPGYINIDDNSPRLMDAVNKAGGLSRLTNINKINLATSIEKANYIYLPFIFENSDVIIIKDKKNKKLKHHKSHNKKKKKYKYKEERFILSTYNTLFKLDTSVSWFDNLINNSFSFNKLKNNLSKSLESINLKALNEDYYREYTENIDSIIYEYLFYPTYIDSYDDEINMFLYRKDLQKNKIYKPLSIKNEHKKEIILNKDLNFSNKINFDNNFPENKVVKININTASKDSLIKVPGIGEKIADRIIEYRTSQKINNKSDLLKIRGIGENTANKLLNYIEF